MNENHQCTICKSQYTESDGGCEGELGIIPVSFCPFCLAGLVDMVEQIQEDIDALHKP